MDYLLATRLGAGQLEWRRRPEKIQENKRRVIREALSERLQMWTLEGLLQLIFHFLLRWLSVWCRCSDNNCTIYQSCPLVGVPWYLNTQGQRGLFITDRGERFKAANDWFRKIPPCRKMCNTKCFFTFIFIYTHTSICISQRTKKHQCFTSIVLV